MLTCRVGKTIINCFDGTYDKHTLKKWSDKNLLICPDCQKPYEYCHGEITSPYFRHKEKNKDCESLYYESETEEHLKGKKLLYEYFMQFQTKGEIKNLKLEAYIPETKQRPDIYFEKDGQRWVFEFQCTPIASQYLNRHMLYQLVNIKDVWIMGIEKYNIRKTMSNVIIHELRYKTLEKYSHLYLNINQSLIYMNSSNVIPMLPYKRISENIFYCYNLEDFEFKLDGSWNLKDDKLADFITKDQELNEEFLAVKKREIEYKNFQKDVIERLNLSCKEITPTFECKYGRDCCSYYDWSIEATMSNCKYYFFIKNEGIDFCFYSKKKGYLTLNKASFDTKNKDLFLETMISQVKEEHSVINTKVFIIDGNYNISDLNISFHKNKFRESYIFDDFWNLCRDIREKLKNEISESIYILANQLIEGQSISNRNRLNIVKRFNNHGFSNVKFYE